MKLDEQIIHQLAIAARDIYDESVYVTTGELAELIGISDDRVRTLTSKGVITPAYGYQYHWISTYIRLSAIDDIDTRSAFKYHMIKQERDEWKDKCERLEHQLGKAKTTIKQNLMLLEQES